MEKAVLLLNNMLEIDRSAISHMFLCNNHAVDLKIAESTIELDYVGSDTYGNLGLLGMLNGVLHSEIVTDKRIDVVMRDHRTIERFELAPKPEALDISCLPKS